MIYVELRWIDSLLDRAFWRELTPKSTITPGGENRQCHAPPTMASDARLFRIDNPFGSGASGNFGIQFMCVPAAKKGVIGLAVCERKRQS